MPTKQTLRGWGLSVAWATVLGGGGTAGLAQAACLDEAQVQTWLSHYEAKTPAPNPPADFTAADAACTRARFLAAMEAKGARPVGYKAGLTNPAVQKRFQTDQPVWGRLYAQMLLRDGVSLPATFGARPLYEADLLVRVKDAAINQARTPMEVLQAIDQVAPFIELPDLLVQVPPQLNGAGVAAINVGARLGVVGTPLAVPTARADRYALLDGLGRMQVVVSDGTGAERARGQGSDILEHPLNAVSWLAQALAQEGRQLQPGDWVSLGSFSPLMPPKSGETIRVRYDGVPGLQPVSVRFE